MARSRLEELIVVLHAQLAWTDPVTGYSAALDLNNVGFLIVGLFITVWAAAIAYWELTGVQHRRTDLPTARPVE